MNIHVHLEDGVLELVDNDGFSRLSGGEIHGPKFLIRAAQLGVTTFHVCVFSPWTHAFSPDHQFMVLFFVSISCLNLDM